MKKLEVPKFATEAEEADWWDQHMDVVGEHLIEAIEKGTAHQGGFVTESKARTKRLEENLAALIRAITAEHSNGKKQ
jgi:hypothetical protein